MNAVRLDTELQRLYLAAGAPAPGHPDPDGQVRAMVLELARPAGWEALSRVWQGVQADLDLPAPAIAVNGSDAYQLWFSLAQPLPAVQATAFLAALCRRYLADVGPERIAMHPSAAPALQLPPVEQAPGQWSAFLAPDLAALFVDEPWLDLPPGLDQQAELLAHIGSIKPAELQRAQGRLAATPPAPNAGAGAGTTAAGPAREPRGFLLDVMNDHSVALALRIEAAKALLPYFGERRAP